MLPAAIHRKHDSVVPLATIIVIDEAQQNIEAVRRAVDSTRFATICTADPQEGILLSSQWRPRVALIDDSLPGMDDFDLVDRLLSAVPGIQIIVMSSQHSSSRTAELIARGAVDCVCKPLGADALNGLLDRLRTGPPPSDLPSASDREMLDMFEFFDMISCSPLMRDVFASIRRVAPHYKSVLLQGESGTGKELVARAIQRLNPGKNRTYAVCNCSALVETLCESELFGHVRGAFTGAIDDRVGLFEYANGGTVFLDEIGDMPLGVQAKLLRVLQNHELQRVGSPVTRNVDFRIIAATNRDLKKMVHENTFREDLYYRLSMIEIHLPRLAERMEDLPLLVQHFLGRFAAEFGKPIRDIARGALDLLLSHSWPGNIRELENAIGSACIMTENDRIDVEDLPEYLRTQQRHPAQAAPQVHLSLRDVQRQHIRQVLSSVGGDKTRAAQILGIGRATLYNLLTRSTECTRYSTKA